MTSRAKNRMKYTWGTYLWLTVILFRHYFFTSVGGRLYLFLHQFWIKLKVALIYRTTKNGQAIYNLQHFLCYHIPVIQM